MFISIIESDFLMGFLFGWLTLFLVLVILGLPGMPDRKVDSVLAAQRTCEAHGGVKTYAIKLPNPLVICKDAHLVKIKE